MKLTPAIMQQYGYKYITASGVSGADMWQGMDLWMKNNVVLRGNISTASPGYLRNQIDFNMIIENEEDLKALNTLYKMK
jgi:hypothetical protein